MSKTKTYSLRFSSDTRIQNILEAIDELPNDSVVFLDHDEECDVFFRISEESKNFLKNLCLNKNGEENQIEISGKFTETGISDDGVRNLIVDEENVNYGTEEGANLVNGLYGFHTHPIEAYVNNNVNLGWPSMDDYTGFLISVINFNSIFHVVVTIEGVYIISLRLHWIENLHHLTKSLSAVKKFIKYNFKIKYPKYRTIEEYISRVNEIEYQSHPLFKVEYFPWNADVEFNACFRED